MLEYASRNAELILNAQTKDFSIKYLNTSELPQKSGFTMAIGSGDCLTNGFPVAPSTISIFAIKSVLPREIRILLNTTPNLPPETTIALNSAFDAGMMILDQLALMKFCESESDPQPRVDQMVENYIFDKSTVEQIMPLCRPILGRLSRGVPDEKLIDLLEESLQSKVNQEYSVTEISGIETMCRLYRQTYPYAKRYLDDQTSQLFGL
jgi:hypothetical protein